MQRTTPFVFKTAAATDDAFLYCTFLTRLPTFKTHSSFLGLSRNMPKRNPFWFQFCSILFWAT
jgi:hypothetical protein